MPYFLCKCSPLCIQIRILETLLHFYLQNFEMLSLNDSKKHRRNLSSGSLGFMFEGPMKRVFDSIEVVPTKEAEASR